MLALDGDRLAVGAPRDNNSAGYAYVFERNLGGEEQWGLAQSFSSSAPPNVDGQAGTAVALRGNRLLIGIPYWGRGAVDVYERGASAWTFVETWRPSSGGTVGTCNGTLTLDWNAYQAAHPNALGVPFSVGATISLQAWYRDPPSSNTTALSDALEALTCP